MSAEDFDALSKDDDDDQEDEKNARKKNKNTKKYEDAGEEDDSEDGEAEDPHEVDEDDDEDEDEGRQHKRARTSGLFDLEAEASDEDDEEEPEYDPEMEGFVVGDGAEDDIDDSATLHRALDRGRDKQTEQLVEQLQARHARYVQTPDMDQEDFERSNIRQQARQPTLKDPRLFSVKCKPGMERELCAKLLNKFFHLKKEEDGSDSRLKVFSIVTMDHLKGYIYIEADKAETAKDFVAYINGIWASKIELVKLNEMVPTMTITKKKTTLKRGDWVRIRRGLYANDLAQVTEFDPANERVMVKHVPRIDLDAWSKRESHGAELDEEEKGKGGKRKRVTAAKATRPAPRLFNPEEVRSRSGVVERSRDEATGEIYDTFEKQRFREGFLYRQLKLQAVIINPPPPDLVELQRFQAAGAPRVGGEGGDEELEAGPNMSLQFKAVSELQKRRQVVFQRDDKVLVVEGELKNLVGRVVEIKGDEIRVQPLFDVVNEQALSLPVIPLAAHQLRKHFSNGAHVKVVAGEHSGETGIVVKISDNVATLISDLTMSELRVLSSDLVATAEISTGAKIGDYSLYDLVNLSATESAVIVRIEGDKVVVMDPNGHTRDVKLQALSRRRDTRSVVGKGHDGKPVGMGDKVRIVGGVFRDSTGTIKHVHRANSFVYLKDRAQNSGLVVIRNKMLVVAGEANSAQRRDVFGKTTTAVAPRTGTTRKQNDPLLHKQVTITRGPWKSYQGLVKDATDKEVIVELSSNAKRVSIAKEAVRTLEALNRGPIGSEGFGDWDPTKTPLRGDQTPLRVATPGRPMTPSHDPFNPLATATPFRDGFTDMRTPVGFERRVHTPAPSTPSSLPYSTPMPSTPAPLFTPSTPNASIYPTPSSLPLQTPLMSLPRSMPTPLTAATPGTPGASSLPPRTPQQPVAYTTPLPYSPAPLTPGSVHGYVETPKTPTEQPYGYTPASYVATPTTPNTQSLTTPMTALPPTPGSQYHEPSTPFALPSDAEPENDTLRLFAQVLVKIDASFRPALGGKTASVREVQGDAIVVTVVDTSEQVSVPVTMLAIVTPEKRDPVMIVRGQFAGSRGMLIGIDTPDGIVKMDQGGEIKILKLSYLAKCQK